MRVLVVTAMWPRPDAITLGLFVQEQVASIRRQNIDVDLLRIKPRFGRLRYLVACWQAFRASMAHDYDVVHGHYGPVGLVARCQFRAQHLGLEQVARQVLAVYGRAASRVRRFPAQRRI
jgi:hypothetical protein